MTAMKHSKTFLLTLLAALLILPANIALAQDAATESTPQENVTTAKPEEKTEFVYDKKLCEEASANITRDMTTYTSCWKDEDCVQYDFGYPWQKNACMKTIISKEAKEKEKIIQLLARVEIYKEACIDTNKEETKKYNEMEKQLEQQECTPVPLLCLKGVCRTGTYAVIDSEPYRMKEAGEK
jgi:hypothetical protein